MAATIGITGLVSAAGSGNLNNLIDTVTNPRSFSINVSADSFDATAFGSGLVAATQINGMYSWTASISATYPTTAKTGYQANFAWSDSAYDTLVSGYSLNLTYATFETTTFATSGVGKEFAPGLATWGGTLSALIDSATALTLPHAPNAAVPTVTITLSDEATNDNILSGSATLTSVSPSVAVNSRNEASIGFAGTGDLTVQGDHPLFHATHNSTLETADNDTITFTAASGRTYAGVAFLSSATVNAAKNGELTVDYTLQGTGDLTIA